MPDSISLKPSRAQQQKSPAGNEVDYREERRINRHTEREESEKKEGRKVGRKEGRGWEDPEWMVSLALSWHCRAAELVRVIYKHCAAA